MNLVWSFLIVVLHLLPLVKIASALDIDDLLPQSDVEIGFERRDAPPVKPLPRSNVQVEVERRDTPPANVVEQYSFNMMGAPVNMTPYLDGTQGNGTYPRMNPLSDGTLLGVYTSFLNNYSIITVVHSSDQGSTWEPRGTVARAPMNTTDLDNPYILQLPSGRLLLAMRNHDRLPNTNDTFLFYRITVCYSDDLGYNWEYRSQAAWDYATNVFTGHPKNISNGSWEPFLRNAQDGSVQIYYSRENNDFDQDTLMRTSTDEGLTWTSATTISGAELDHARDGMTGVATISGSRLILVFESNIRIVNVSNLFSVNYIISEDDGKTWGDRTVLYNPGAANNSAGAPQITNVGGTLVCSFMTDEDTERHDWFEGADAKVMMSTDGAKTWTKKTTVIGVQSNWPGMVTISDTSFLVFADHLGAHAQRVSLV